MARTTLRFASSTSRSPLSVGEGKGRPKVLENVLPAKDAVIDGKVIDGYAKIEDAAILAIGDFYAPIVTEAVKATVNLYKKDIQGDVSLVKAKGVGKIAKDYVKIEVDRLETVDGVEVNLKGHWLLTEKTATLTAEAKAAATAEKRNEKKIAKARELIAADEKAKQEKRDAAEKAEQAEMAEVHAELTGKTVGATV